MKNKTLKDILEVLELNLLSNKRKNSSKILNDVEEEIINLYKTKESYSFLQDKNGHMNVPYAWTEMTCPSTGQTYLIDTCPTFTSALESMKFHRPKFVPIEVEYNWSDFTN